MPLNNEHYNLQGLTEAINSIAATPTIIRALGLFKPSYQSTTYVSVERRDNQLMLVDNVPRGTPGLPVSESRKPPKAFHMLHLPKHDIVLADDVQNLRAFGKSTALMVAERVNEKLAAMKADIEYTREHLMLGALMGKIVDAKGNEIVDIYNEFGLKRQSFDWTADDGNINALIDKAKQTMSKKRGGEVIKGYTVLCGAEFLEKITYHKSLHELYVRYQDGKVYREGDTDVAFSHKGINFVLYDHEFESGLKLADNQGIWIPNGTTNTFKEYFAPADKSATVNTLALPYYASREPLAHDKGWDLEAQSNPLPMVLRPELLATITMK